MYRAMLKQIGFKPKCFPADITAKRFLIRMNYGMLLQA